MQTTKTHTVRVPGANLYHEVRGSGPILLLICGGVYDAAAYAGLAQQLADRYTVVTYDRRGNSRSPLDAPAAPQSIEVHGADAHRVLSAFGVTVDEPAYVFGNSSGATIGLELATRHPEQVRTLVAHEPPLFELLPDRDHWRTTIRNVEDAFVREGAAAAMQVLGAAFATSGDPTPDREGRLPGGGEAPQREPDPETMEMMARFQKNMEFFIGCEVPPFNNYVPDIGALWASSVRVAVAVGEASKDEPQGRAAIAVAERLGTKPAAFPGDQRRLRRRPASVRCQAPRGALEMKYMLLIYDNPDTREIFFSDEGQPLMAEMDAILNELRESGELVSTEALADPSNTRTVRAQGGLPVVTDGPLAEAKEHFGGYMVIDCESVERAVDIATRWPSARFCPLEVRPIMDTGGPDV